MFPAPRKRNDSSDTCVASVTLLDELALGLLFFFWLQHKVHEKALNVLKVPGKEKRS